MLDRPPDKSTALALESRSYPFKPIDLAKAAAVAMVVLVLNVLVAILVVFGYSILIEPGHPQEFYNAAALRIAPWCSHIAGTALCLGAGYLCAKRRPQRNGYVFATVFTVLYAIIDSATVGFVGVVTIEFALSMLAKLLAALAGAFLGTRKQETSMGRHGFPG